MSARTSTKQRLAAALAVLALALASALPGTAFAEVSPDAPEFKDLKEFLGELGFQPDAIAEIAGATNADKLADWFNPNDLAPDTAVKRTETDITHVALFELEADEATVDGWFAAAGPLATGSPGVVNSANPAGAPRATEWYAYATVLGGPLAGDGGGRIEAGLAAFTTTPPGGTAGVRYEADKQFPGDFFNGFNVAWSTRSDVAGKFQLLSFNYLTNGGAWTNADTDAVSVIRGRLMITLIPEGEASGFQDARAFSFAGFAAGTSVDTYPDIPLGAFDITALPGIVIGENVATQPPVATAGPGSSTTPATAAPNATQAPGASAAPTSGGSTGAIFGIPWWLLVLAGLLVAAFGFFLLRPPKRAGNVPILAPGGLVVAGTNDDPCPPLIATAKAARAACDEAQRAAAAAAQAASARSAEADTAKREAERAKAAREAAEKELAKRQKPPNQGNELGSTDFGGRHVSVDEYDLKLQADARAAANVAHAAAVAAAGSEAERNAAHDAWQQELKKIDGPDGLDEVRRRDKAGREAWVKEAEATLKAALDAEAAATAAANRASEAATAAQQAADAARARAAEACAAADRAEAAAADCLKAQAKPTPVTPDGPGGDGGATTTGGGTTAGGGTAVGGGTSDGGGTATAGGTTPGGGTTPPKPHGGQCPDGTEQWRSEPPSATFVVPVPGEKVRMSVIPGIDAFTEYYDGWTGFGADGRPLEGTTEEGIPPSSFVRADDSRWNQLFGQIGKKAKHNEITITLPLQSVEVHCERLYKCVNGYWERQAQTRAVESDPVAKPASFHIEGEVITTNEVVILGRTAVNAMKAAEQARHDLATFSSRCR